MKTMIISDLAILRPMLPQWAAISVFVGIALGWGMDSVAAAAAAVTGMVPFMLMFTLAATDEQNGWDRFRLALPLTRRQVVFGRYVSLGLAIFATMAFVLLLSAVYLAVASAFPDGVLPEGLAPENNSLSISLFGVLIAAFVIVLALGITLPFVMRFGMTQATRIVPIVVVIALAFGVSFASPYFAQASGAIESLAHWLDTGLGYVVASIALAAVATILFVISASVTAKLYEKREF